MGQAIMSRSEYLRWKENMETKIEKKELSPIEEHNVRVFCALQLIKPCYHDDEIEEIEED